MGVAKLLFNHLLSYTHRFIVSELIKFFGDEPQHDSSLSPILTGLVTEAGRCVVWWGVCVCGRGGGCTFLIN